MARDDAASAGVASAASESAAVAERPRAPSRRRGEDTSHAGLMAALHDEERTRSLVTKLTFMARSRYGLRPDDSEDVFHESVTTYLSIHGRYPPNDNHFGLLVGIFRKKCLEHLGSRERSARITRRFVARIQNERPDIARGEDPKGPTVGRVIRREDAELIRAAIASLSGEGREMLLTLAEGRKSRLELIEEMGINRNTFDTRLRALRLRLRDTLRRGGVL